MVFYIKFGLTKHPAFELYEVVFEELFVEAGLDVYLIFFYRFLLLLDEIVFGSSLARGAIGGELGDLGNVLGDYLLQRVLKDVSLKPVINGINFCSKAKNVVADVLAGEHEISV